MLGFGWPRDILSSPVAPRGETKQERDPFESRSVAVWSTQWSRTMSATRSHFLLLGAYFGVLTK